MIKVTKVTVDGSELIKTLQTLTSDEEFMTEVQSEFRDIVDPYVPYDTGYLSQDSVRIDATGVTYTAEYAEKQYYGVDFHHNTETHPLATAFWDEVAMETQYEILQAKIVELIGKRINDGQK